MHPAELRLHILRIRRKIDEVRTLLDKKEQIIEPEENLDRYVREKIMAAQEGDVKENTVCRRRFGIPDTASDLKIVDRARKQREDKSHEMVQTMGDKI
ncbi:hypothetical protein KKF81_03900 [Candidatus Micrarchaeota archaeon]|nr:hypothetical protein [Candidatus Micrarchaeota archaeon]MBU1166068.1 hypothetical protein [Candidatus Micrarchaeota archaeon]MBU1886684.1 hypothetical protein [Candidatus Micrarchaeota archaeon]